MFKGKWLSILLFVCGLVLAVGGILTISECIESGNISETIWALFRGILLVIFAIGLTILGIRNYRK